MSKASPFEKTIAEAQERTAARLANEFMATPLTRMGVVIVEMLARGEQLGVVCMALENVALTLQTQALALTPPALRIRAVDALTQRMATVALDAAVRGEEKFRKGTKH